MHTGRIIEWNDARGFGYVQGEHGRLFVHIRDFVDRERRPVVGDPITFVVGADKQGRPCAQKAVLLGSAGRLRPSHALILIFLILPAVAMQRLRGAAGLSYGAAWVVVLSILTYASYAHDKRAAREKAWRLPETVLHLLEFLGGWPGAFFAQRKLRHKSSKGPFLFVFVMIIGLHQFLAIDALLGWPFVTALKAALSRIFH